MLIIVSMIVTTGLDACGAGASVEGICPASTVPDRAHARASVIAKRFICSPLNLRDASLLAITENSADDKLLAGLGNSD